MSGALGFGLIGAANVASVLLRRRRRIATIIPDAVIEEVGVDELAITDHPVERGAPISDHAYKRPPELIMKVGWSNSASVRVAGFAIPGLSQGALSAITSFGEADYVSKVYERLLKLQTDLEPFDITAGKRVYKNMLLASLASTTDVTSENALMVVARFRQVLIVEVQVATVPPRDQQAEPEATAPTENGGPVPIEREDLPPLAGP